MDRDRNGIEVRHGTGSVWGFAARAVCNRAHEGSRALALQSGTYYECQGCLTLYGASEIHAAIATRRPLTGDGGIAYHHT